MTWTKLGAEFANDPRLLKVSRSIRFMHIEAMLHCNEQTTDGYITGRALARVTDQPRPAEAAAALVAAGLWEITDQGRSTRQYRIVDFLKDQPSKESVERDRSAAAVRSERARLHRSGEHSHCNPSWCYAWKRGNGAGQDVSSRRESRLSVPSVPFRSEGLRNGKGKENRASSSPDAAAASGRSIGSLSAEEENYEQTGLTVITPAGW